MQRLLSQPQVTRCFSINLRKFHKFLVLPIQTLVRHIGIGCSAIYVQMHDDVRLRHETNPNFAAAAAAAASGINNLCSIYSRIRKKNDTVMQSKVQADAVTATLNKSFVVVFFVVSTAGGHILVISSAGANRLVCHTPFPSCCFRIDSLFFGFGSSA
jgi:hypothetical protein